MGVIQGQRKIEKRFFALFLSLLLFAVCGCNASTKPPNQNVETTNHVTQGETESQNVKTGGISHGIISPNPLDTNFTLEYNGDPIKTTYSLTNGMSEDEWGLTAYVNGFQQEFFVDNQTTPCLMYKHSFQKDEKQELDISFVPVFGNKGDTLLITFVAILNPSYILVKDEKTQRYGNEHSTSQITWMIKINVDINNSSPKIETIGTKHEITKEQYERHIGNFDENMTPLSDSVIYDFYKDDVDEIEFTLSDNAEFHADFIGCFTSGTDRKYRLSIYADHELLNTFSNASYAEFSVQSNKCTSISVELNEEMLQGKNFIYFIAVPLLEKDDEFLDLPKLLKCETKAIIPL